MEIKKIMWYLKSNLFQLCYTFDLNVISVDTREFRSSVRLDPV